jgi:segregation and condensation protein B
VTRPGEGEQGAEVIVVTVDAAAETAEVNSTDAPASDVSVDAVETATPPDNVANENAANENLVAAAPQAAPDTAVLRQVVEALVFASSEPLAEKAIVDRLPAGTDVPALLREIASDYAQRGIRLVKIGECWAFRTAPELAPHLRLERKVARKLSRAALEALGIVAYHQPVTRADIEEIRGVALSRGTLDVLLECGWIKPGKRRRTPGRPLTWVTTQEFLDHFQLEKIEDLPGLEELKASGLLDTRPRVHVLQPGSSEEEAGNEEAEEEGDEPLLDLDEANIPAEDDEPANDPKAR